MTSTDDPLDGIAIGPPAPMPSRATGGRVPSPARTVRHIAGGIGAIGAKELRGRMRGRRAFVILTLYLVLLAGFAGMVELMMARSYSTTFGTSATYATAAIGQGIFVALMMLETLLVVFLAPMATVGSISLEREKQTLDMLAATPISSISIVLGKLLSALVYVWLLIAASIPLTAVVFVFGGVAPDDLVRSYLVLIVTALGLGAFGLCCSSLVKRTQAATAIAIFGVLAVTVGSLFVVVFWQSVTETSGDRAVGQRGSSPDALIYLNPFLAQADIAPVDALCATESAMNEYCRYRARFLGQSGVFFGIDNGKGSMPVPAIGVGVAGAEIVPADSAAPEPGGPLFVIADAIAFDAADPIWQKTVVSWLLLSVVFLLISVQAVSPTRRWHLRRRRDPDPLPEAV